MASGKHALGEQLVPRVVEAIELEKMKSPGEVTKKVRSTS
jgi:hypothetical protein